MLEIGTAMTSENEHVVICVPYQTTTPQNPPVVVSNIDVDPHLSDANESGLDLLTFLENLTPARESSNLTKAPPVDGNYSSFLGSLVGGADLPESSSSDSDFDEESDTDEEDYVIDISDAEDIEDLEDLSALINDGKSDL